MLLLLLLQELIRSMLEVEVDQRYTALQVLEHPWVTVSTVLIDLILACFQLKYFHIKMSLFNTPVIPSSSMFRMRVYVKMITSCQ